MVNSLTTIQSKKHPHRITELESRLYKESCELFLANIESCENFYSESSKPADSTGSPLLYTGVHGFDDFPIDLKKAAIKHCCDIMTNPDSILPSLEQGSEPFTESSSLGLLFSPLRWLEQSMKQNFAYFVRHNKILPLLWDIAIEGDFFKHKDEFSEWYDVFPVSADDTRCYSKWMQLCRELSIRMLTSQFDILGFWENPNVYKEYIRNSGLLLVRNGQNLLPQQNDPFSSPARHTTKVGVPTELNNNERDLFQKSFCEILDAFAKTGIWITQKIDPDTLVKLKAYLSNPCPQSRDKYMLDIAVTRIYLLELVLREIRSDFCKMLDKHPLEVATVIPIINSKAFRRYQSLETLLDKKNWKGYIDDGKGEYLAYVNAPEDFFKFEKELESYLLRKIPALFFPSIGMKVINQVRLGRFIVDLHIDLGNGTKFFIELKKGKRDPWSSYYRDHEEQRERYEGYGDTCLLLYAGEIHLFAELIKHRRHDKTLLAALRSVF
jgi:hypothetical protein